MRVTRATQAQIQATRRCPLQSAIWGALTLALACQEPTLKPAVPPTHLASSEPNAPFASEQAPQTEPPATASTTSMAAPLETSPRSPKVVSVAAPETDELHFGPLGRLQSASLSRPIWRTADKRAAEETLRNTAADGAPAATIPTRWRLTRTIWVGQSYLHHAEFSADDSLLFAYSELEGVLRTYDPNTGKLRSKQPTPQFSEFASVALSPWPKGNALLVGDKLGISLHQEGQPPRPLSNLHVRTLQPSLSGRYLAATRAYIPQQVSTQSLFSYDLENKELRQVAEFSFSERVDAWALSSNDELLTLGLYPSDDIEQLDLKQRQVLWRRPAPKYLGAIALSPNGLLIAAGGDRLEVYAASSGILLASDEAYGNNIGNVRFSPSGDLLIATAYDGKARSYVINPAALPTANGTTPGPASGKLLSKAQLLKHRGHANVYAISFSKNGRRLVTSSGDQTLKLWRR